MKGIVKRLDAIEVELFAYLTEKSEIDLACFITGIDDPVVEGKVRFADMLQSLIGGYCVPSHPPRIEASEAAKVILAFDRLEADIAKARKKLDKIEKR